MQADATCSTESLAKPISSKTRLALGVIYGSLAMGALTDALLRATPWGINLFLWSAALVACYGCLARWAPPHRSDPTTVRLLVCSLLFAACSAWRDSSTLKLLDVASVLTMLILVNWHQQGGSLFLGTLTGYLRALSRFFFSNIMGVLLVLHKLARWKEVPTHHWASHTGPVFIGLLLSAPLVLVFGTLFSAADATFHNLAIEFFQPEKLISHGVVIGLGSWFACGYLRNLLLTQRSNTPPVATTSQGPSLGSIELGIVLTCLNALFLCFILIQLRYFFGGETQLEITPGLLRSEYARRGFFELVAVATLLLPLLLAADWLHRNEHRKTFFRISASVLVAMLFVVLASALQRMWIYQHEFGLTELRLYSTAFMGWIATVFAWFVLTVLRGRRERFAFGSLTAALLGILLLHCVNPDALIVQVNAHRATRDGRFDADYATSLSADAIPALVKSLPSLPPADQAIVRQRLWNWNVPKDWRNWSYSRHAATSALRFE